MKIILTVHQFMPEFSSGTEVLTFTTARELKRRGHEVEIWAGHPSDVDTARKTPFMTYEYEGLKIVRYNHNYRVPPLNKNVIEAEYNDTFVADHFRRHLTRIRPDIVHFFHLLRLSGSLVDVCKEAHVSSVYTPTDFWMICPTCQLRLPGNEPCLGPDSNSVNCLRHTISRYIGMEGIIGKLPDGLMDFSARVMTSPWFPEKKYSALVRSLIRRNGFLNIRMNQIDRVLTPTRMMERILSQNGLNPDKVRFMPYGLDMGPFERYPVKTRHGGRLRVGFIGTINEHKGAHVLLEAVKLIPADLPLDVKIYGNGNEFPAYTAKLKRIAAGDERVEFCGHFKNDRIGEVFSNLDVIVVPSIWYENAPLVIYSAHASRTPVIATNLGGMSEIVHHEKNGLLFEKGNSVELSRLLRRILEDRMLLDRLARNIVPPVSIPGYVDGLEKVYSEILREGR